MRLNRKPKGTELVLYINGRMFGRLVPQSNRPTSQLIFESAIGTMVKQRYVLLDVSALLESVRSYMRTQARFGQDEVAGIPITDVTLDAVKLKRLLRDDNAVEMSRLGFYLSSEFAEARAWMAAGWEMQMDIGRRSLDDSLDRILLASETDWTLMKRTLALVTGELPPSTMQRLSRYLRLGWTVQLFMLAASRNAELDQLEAEHPRNLEFIYLDTGIYKLMKRRELKEAPEPSRFQRWYHHTLTRNSNTDEARATSDRHGPRPVETAHNCCLGRCVVNQAETDQEIVRQKQRLLAQLPRTQMPYSSHKRFVVIDMDKIAKPLFNCSHLYPQVAGAKSAQELRFSFARLTNHVCGYSSALVQEKFAVYSSTHPWLLRRLEDYGWNTQKETAWIGESMMQKRLGEILRAETAPPAPRNLVVVTNEECHVEKRYDDGDMKTLVLVTSDNCPVHGESALTGIVTSFLDQNWCVEIHSWLHALHEDYIGIQRDYPQQFAVRPLDDALQQLVYVKPKAQDVGLWSTGGTRSYRREDEWFRRDKPTKQPAFSYHGPFKTPDANHDQDFSARKSEAQDVRLWSTGASISYRVEAPDSELFQSRSRYQLTEAPTDRCHDETKIPDVTCNQDSKANKLKKPPDVNHDEDSKAPKPEKQQQNDKSGCMLM